MSRKRSVDDIYVSDTDPRESKRRRAPDSLMQLLNSMPVTPKVATAIYKGGAVRITRTPGRIGDPNVVSLDDIICGQKLNSAFVAAFCIENDYFFSYFPLKQPSVRGSSIKYVPRCKIYVSRDIRYDPLAPLSVTSSEKSTSVSAAEFHAAVKQCETRYKSDYGENIVPCYTRISGTSHSKIMVLSHSMFLRIVITSANFIRCDAELVDNHWFIQDFEKLKTPREQATTDFEIRLWDHLRALGCPEEFISTHEGCFDFTEAKVNIVTSQPRSVQNKLSQDTSNFGLLRLQSIVRQILAYQASDSTLHFEICSASLGHLSREMITSWLEVLKGRPPDKTKNDSSLPISFIFPTRKAVLERDPPGKDNASCRTRWTEMPDFTDTLREKFYQYVSSDSSYRPLFHLKTILALNKSSQLLYLYLGSANFSQSAWRAYHTMKKHPASLECGIVIKAKYLSSMVVGGQWESIIPYTRPSTALRYVEGDKAWVTSAFNKETPPELDLLQQVLPLLPPDIAASLKSAEPDAPTLLAFLSYYQNSTPHNGWVY